MCDCGSLTSDFIFLSEYYNILHVLFSSIADIAVHFMCLNSPVHVQETQSLSVTRSNTSSALDLDDERRRKEDLVLK